MGDSMKRAAWIVMATVAVLTLATWAATQGYGQTQNPPAAGQTTQGGQAAQGTPPAPGAPAAPQGKRPPKAETQPEFDAYKVAAAVTDPAALEKAADDFAIKFPNSELRLLLYKMSTRAYQSANSPDKSEAMARKVLAIDGDDPESLVVVAEVISDRTHDSDLDKDQRYDEAMKMAQKAIQTVDTDLAVPADKLDMAKAFLRSSAYSIMGTIEFKKDSFAAAQVNLQKSIDAFPAQLDPVVVLRLAIALDKQQKYPEALKVANQAVDLTKEGTQVGTLARHERDRLQQLTGGAPVPAPAPAPAPAATPAPPPSQPPKN
jgi:tetratricopeptide (TPR) repeat protein